jgi:deoxynucleoside kinase
MNIHIEGNIGAGKSTFLNFIKDNFECNVSQEPVKEWMSLADGDENILDKFYKDIPRWSFAFQMNCFISRSHQTKNMPNNQLNFIERSIYSDKIFATNCFQNGNMNPIEMEIYTKWSSWLEKELCDTVDSIIYLRSSPSVSYNRIKERSRKGEECIPLEYLIELHRLHDEWLENTNIPVYVLDADHLNYDDPELINFIGSNFFNLG